MRLHYACINEYDQLLARCIMGYWHCWASGMLHDEESMCTAFLPETIAAYLSLILQDQ